MLGMKFDALGFLNGADMRKFEHELPVPLKLAELLGPNGCKEIRHTTVLLFSKLPLMLRSENNRVSHVVPYLADIDVVFRKGSPSMEQMHHQILAGPQQLTRAKWFDSMSKNWLGRGTIEWALEWRKRTKLSRRSLGEAFWGKRDVDIDLKMSGSTTMWEEPVDGICTEVYLPGR